ncbi:hypothetical protein EBQ81_00310, partial [bacterium]|nr:hypothetical protein [bacterium]
MSTTNTGSIPSGLFKLSDITNAVRSGARSNLFEVEISTFDPSQTAQGASTELQLLFKYMCKGGQLPGSTLGLIEVPFMAGRRYKIAGDRTFAEWTSTIISDVNQKIREALEELQELYSSTNFNSDVARKLVGSQPTDFLLLDIKQYD